MQAAVNMDNAFCDFPDRSFFYDKAFDSWVRENVISAYDAYKADPDQGLSSDDLRANLLMAGAKRG